jgi:hypothetical protein
MRLLHECAAPNQPPELDRARGPDASKRDRRDGRLPSEDEGTVTTQELLGGRRGEG